MQWPVLGCRDLVFSDSGVSVVCNCNLRCDKLSILVLLSYAHFFTFVDVHFY